MPPAVLPNDAEENASEIGGLYFAILKEHKKSFELDFLWFFRDLDKVQSWRPDLAKHNIIEIFIRI